MVDLKVNSRRPVMPAVRQSCVVVRERWHPVSVQLVVVCSTPGEGYFGDESPPEGSPVFEWHLNFAHSDLFEFYGGSLCAQDEKQAAVPPRRALEQRFHGPRGSCPAITPPTISSPWKSCRAAAVVTLAIKIEGRFSAAFTEFAVAGIESCQAPQSHGPYGLQGGGALRRQPDPGGRVATPCRPIDTPRVSHGRDRRFSARPASTPDCATRRGVRRARCLISCFRWSRWSFRSA